MYIVVRMEGKHSMGYGCICVLVCVCFMCVVCVQNLVIEYEDVLKVLVHKTYVTSSYKQNVM